MQTIVCAVFQRLFDDGRVRSLWAIGLDQIGRVVTFTRVNGDKMVKTESDASAYDTLLQEKADLGFQPAGMYEVSNAVLGNRIGDVEPEILAKYTPRKLEVSTPNLYFRGDGLKPEWTKKAAEVASKMFESCAVGPRSIAFGDVKITEAEGQSQGVIYESAGLEATLTMLAIAKHVEGFSLADFDGNEVKPTDLQVGSKHLSMPGVTQDVVNDLAERLGIQRNIQKLLSSVGGGIPVFSL